MSHDVVIHRVTALDLMVEPWTWPFAKERRAEIDAYFEGMRREKPKLWNGRVLLARDIAAGDGRLSSSYFETDFASMLAWRDWGYVDRAVFNGFGMGALRSSDGAFVLGEMGTHTSNAGRIYFPAGTPDLDDVVDGKLDIAGSVAREVEEETGLTPSDYRAANHWHCVMAGSAIALMRLLSVDLPGDELKARIEANISRQENAELSGVRLVRRMDDLPAGVPVFVTAYLEQEFKDK